MSIIITDYIKNNFADPLNKAKANVYDYIAEQGYPDVRVHLMNTVGYENWLTGQRAYEQWEEQSTAYKNEQINYLQEIERDKELYGTLGLSGSFLDVGGGIGTVREFLNINDPFVSIDPFENLSIRTPNVKREVYKCLSRPLPFICGFAEFLPFQDGCFDIVHMRSMLDHVQVPDLAMLEARRVLNIDGKLVIGMTVEGGNPAVQTPLTQLLKEKVKSGLGFIGFERYVDHHTWHPTYEGLLKLITTNGFELVEEHWQQGHDNKVVYAVCKKIASVD
jgi:ubiquinone/menaquinone biosynthesis C-methylase UbiE